MSFIAGCRVMRPPGMEDAKQRGERASDTIILGRTVHKSAFRKRVREGDFLEEVPGKQRHGSNRPAQLYRVRDGQPLVYFNRTMTPLR